MIDAVAAGDLSGIVGAAVVDDEPFDRSEPVDLPRQICQRDGKRPRFVQARNLDDEFQKRPR